MKIEIKLKDSRICEGCPCCSSDDIGSACSLGYWNLYKEMEFNNAIKILRTGEIIQRQPEIDDEALECVNIRPQKCIDELGL